MSISALYTLQTIDSELDTRRKRLAEVEHALGESAELRQTRQVFADAQTRLATAEKRQKQGEQEALAQEQKIQQSEQDLYSGRIRIPKEASALQEKIQSMKRHKGVIEDQILEIMVEVESASQELAARQQHLAAVQSVWENAQHDLLSEKETLQARIAELVAARSKTVTAIPPGDLATYENLRKQKAGRAVAAVQRNACSSCGVAIPTAQIQQIRTSQAPVFCRSCSRILYIP